MKNEITIKIDFEKITQDVLEKETYAEGDNIYNVIQTKIKEEVKNWVKDIIVNEIKNKLNLEEFRGKNYSKGYLLRTANEFLEKELSELVKDRVEAYIKGNMRYIIEKQAEKNIEEFIIPRLQKMISNLIVINQEVADEEIQALKDDYEDRIKDMEDSL